MSRTTTTRIVAVVVCIVLLQFRYYYYLGKLSDFDVQVQSLAERSAEADEDRLPSIAYSFNGYHGDYFSIPVALAAVFQYHISSSRLGSVSNYWKNPLLHKFQMNDPPSGPSSCVPCKYCAKYLTAMACKRFGLLQKRAV